MIDDRKRTEFAHETVGTKQQRVQGYALELRLYNRFVTIADLFLPLARSFLYISPANL